MIFPGSEVSQEHEAPVMTTKLDNINNCMTDFITIYMYDFSVPGLSYNFVTRTFTVDLPTLSSGTYYPELTVLYQALAIGDPVTFTLSKNVNWACEFDDPTPAILFV